MSDTLPPLLLGLFRELKAAGVPVGVRDYLDGLEALRLGFGQGSRAALRELAIALWGRSDEERRLKAFNDVAHVLKRRIELMLALPPKSLASLTIQSQLDAIGKI